MRAPLSWLREYVDLPADVTGRELAERLVAAGLEVETVERPGHDVDRPGRASAGCSPSRRRPRSNGKTIRWCQVDVGEAEPRGIVCGARNFAVGDLVVVALPGAVLPGGFAITARKTYGHVSDGMICSEPRARHRRRPRRHPGARPTLVGDAVPGADAVELLELRDEVLDIAVTPDRGVRAVDPRHRPRGRHGVRRGVPRPGRRSSRCRSTAPATPVSSPTRRRPTGSCCAPSPGSTPRRRAAVDARRLHAVPACGRCRWPSTSPTT